MSIIIRGMEMPTSCKDCPCFREEYFYCRAKEGDNIGLGNRPNDCPLVPVSDHGGLIGREKMLDAIRLELAQAKACEDMEDYESWVHTFHFVRKFPIIIEEDPPKEET